jgi:hypothetical protein
MPPADQKRFDDLYDEDAERNARSLASFGIDGTAVFLYARRIAKGIDQTGTVTCTGKPDAAT